MGSLFFKHLLLKLVPFCKRVVMCGRHGRNAEQETVVWRTTIVFVNETA